MLHFLRNTKILALAVLIFLGTLLGVAHNRALENNESFFAEDAIRVVIKPFQAGAASIGRFFKGVSGSMRSRRALLNDKKQLQTEVRRLNAEVVQLREDAAETVRLRSALGMKEQSTERLLATRIISRSASEWFTTATIDRGTKDGVQPGQAVITPRGLIGQVFESSPTSSQIRSLTDAGSGVGAMVQRSRAVGMCQGQGASTLRLTYLSKEADIKPGDIVITSGQGEIVPKGLPIGRVLKIQPESGGFTKTGLVRPSIDFDRVEEAFVVLREVD